MSRGEKLAPSPSQGTLYTLPPAYVMAMVQRLPPDAVCSLCAFTPPFPAPPAPSVRSPRSVGAGASAVQRP